MQNKVNKMSHGMSVQLRSSSGFQSRLPCTDIGKGQQQTARTRLCCVQCLCAVAAAAPQTTSTHTQKATSAATAADKVTLS